MENMKNSIEPPLVKVLKLVSHYKRELIVAASVVAGIIVLSFGYSFYIDSVQRRAQSSFVEAMKYFDGKVIPKEDEKDDTLDFDKYTFSSSEEKWNKVSSVFEKAFQTNKSAGIAPIFLAYQAEALFNLKKLTEAIEKLQYAVELMAKSDVKTAYQVKLALMQIDSDIKDKVETGVKSLEKLSLEKNQPLLDMILYRLGEYYWYAKDYTQAKNYWNRLVLKYGKTADEPSWWVSMAKPKLKLINAK